MATLLLFVLIGPVYALKTQFDTSTITLSPQSFYLKKYQLRLSSPHIIVNRTPPGTEIVTQTDTDNTLSVPLMNYPNPFRLETGTEFGYELPYDMDIEMKVFNLLGQEIWSKKVTAGHTYAEGNNVYNKMPFTINEALASGVYFYVLIGNGSVIGKNKMAILP
mgnify:CR=1 FL=1